MPRLRRFSRTSNLPLLRAGPILTLAAGFVLLALPGPAPAEHILYMKLEFPPIAYGQGTAHVTSQLAPQAPHAHTFVPAPPVFPPAFFQSPPLPATPSTVWETSFVIGESAPCNAFLYSAPSSLISPPPSAHIQAPHAGEKVPGPPLRYSLTASVSEPPVMPGFAVGSIADSRSSQVVPHGHHRDLQVVAMAAFWFKISKLPPSVNELRGYVHGSVGIHLAGNGFGGAAILGGKEEVPPNDSTAVGVVPMVVDEEESTFSVLRRGRGRKAYAALHRALASYAARPDFYKAWDPLTK